MRKLKLSCTYSICFGVAWLLSSCSHLVSSQMHDKVGELDFVGSWEGVGNLDWRTNTFCRLELLTGGVGVCVENYSVVWPSTTVYRVTSWDVNQWGRLVGTMYVMDGGTGVPVRLVACMAGKGMNFSINWGVEGGSVAYLMKVPALRDQMRVQAQYAKNQLTQRREPGHIVTNNIYR